MCGHFKGDDGKAISGFEEADPDLAEESWPQLLAGLDILGELSKK
jgi:hypothetical protein